MTSPSALSNSIPKFKRPEVVIADPEGPIVDQLAERLAGEPVSLILVFSPKGAQVADLSKRLHHAFGPQSTVLACSSAGGFAFDGYMDDKAIIIAFPLCSFAAQAIWLSGLHHHAALDWITALRAQDQAFKPDIGPRKFGLLLVDGMSGREELVAATVDAALPNLLVLGGSAGDGLRFENTHLAMNGEQRRQSALLCMISTEFEVEEVVFDHFLPLGETMVVTSADVERRLIYEINAEPAAAEYARLIGVQPADLLPSTFAENPLLERSGGRHFVRAVTSATQEGALKLLSAVETGTLLTLGVAESLTEGLKRRLQQIGPAELILGFDCILRRLAIERAGAEQSVTQLCQEYRIAGFNTYGEQYGGIHVNQTFVGLALLKPDNHKDDVDRD